MKKLSLLIFIIAALNAGFFDSFKSFIPTEKRSSYQLNENEIAKGLKEALQKGVNYAVENLGKTDGFLKNPKVHIPLPKSIQKIADILKKAGMENYVNSFETSLNRAAEKAAPESADIFIDVIKNITINDAKKILSTDDSAATKYLREKSYDRLYKLIYPIVKENVDKSGAVKYYNLIKENYNRYAKPYTENKTFSSIKNIFFHKKEEDKILDDFSQKDIYDYTTKKTLDGIFKMIEEEEIKIRKNPVERTSELLKKVFGR